MQQKGINRLMSFWLLLLTAAALFLLWRTWRYYSLNKEQIDDLKWHSESQRQSLLNQRVRNASCPCNHPPEERPPSWVLEEPPLGSAGAVVTGSVAMENSSDERSP